MSLTHSLNVMNKTMANYMCMTCSVNVTNKTVANYGRLISRQVN